MLDCNDFVENFMEYEPSLNCFLIALPHCNKNFSMEAIMQNQELRQFFAKNLAKLDYNIRELQQAYVLCGDPDESLGLGMQRVQEAIVDMRESCGIRIP